MFSKKDDNRICG